MKLKSITALMLVLLIGLLPAEGGRFGSPPAEAQAVIHVEASGRLLEPAHSAYSAKGVTMGPMKEIAMALNVALSYGKNEEGKAAVSLSREGRTVDIAAGSRVAAANGAAIPLDAAPEVRDGALYAPLRPIFEALGYAVVWDARRQTVAIHEPLQLPSVETPDRLLQLLRQTADRGYGPDYLATAAIVEESGVADAGAAEAETPGKDGGYSATNVQTAGVEEADWAKTDGTYMYQISGSSVFIADISKPDRPKLAAEIDYANDHAGFRPQELYVDGTRLVVIGREEALHAVGSAARTASGSAIGLQPDSPSMAIEPAEPMPDMPYVLPSVGTTSAFVYELSADGSPVLVRELAQEGEYVSSRMIGSALYIVTNKYSYGYAYQAAMAYADAKERGNNAVEEAAREEELARWADSYRPKYKDTAVTEEMQALPLDRIRYFPEPANDSLLLVGAADLERTDQPLQISAYLGSGSTIYASNKHLYVAIPEYTPDGDGYQEQTRIHKFRLDRGETVYLGEGAVPGSPLNQFSMDEHEGFFRIALTKGNMWATGKNRSSNNVYVLDESMNIAGRLEGLAPGERIYSVRFMGKRAYMVTFRNVDPLFVIDLASPSAPQVLGQLKIPGYSDYLHPYDDNHLIGFGKDTAEAPAKGSGPDSTVAYYQGLKMALFDVSDVANPKEKFKEMIGARGTDSELLRNHKALLFSKEKGILAFPVELYEMSEAEAAAGGVSAYGQFAYQGAYVYGIDLNEGFRLRGRISHLDEEDMRKSGQYGYDYAKAVKRILYADSALYTLSETMLKAHDLNSLTEQGSLVYPERPSGGGAREIRPLPVQTIVE